MFKDYTNYNNLNVTGKLGSYLGEIVALGGRNFALNGTQGKVGVPFIFFFLFFFRETHTALYFSFHLMAIVCVMANLFQNCQIRP